MSPAINYDFVARRNAHQPVVMQLVDDELCILSSNSPNGCTELAVIFFYDFAAGVCCPVKVVANVQDQILGLLYVAGRLSRF